MIEYPFLKNRPSTRQVVDIFRGYNHNLRIGNGEFYEMENMTSEDCPVLSTRGKRGVLADLHYGCAGMLYVPGKGLFYLEDIGGNSVLYLRTQDGTVTQVASFNPNRKTLVLIGTRLVIAPDMKWVDIESLACGDLGEKWAVRTDTVAIQMCDIDGNVYQDVTYSPEPPSAPGYHELWLCNAIGSIGLRQYETLTSEWVSIPSTYLKLTGLGDHHFHTYDAVDISGLIGTAIGLNGSHLIRRTSHGDIVISGIMTEAHKPQDCTQNPITIERKVPELDFLVESGNRLWGCRKDTNEIYASKLGDITNWNCFQGLSTDSWVGSIGTPGEFTGAIVQNGYPVFYKENCKHKVWPSATGAHQITTVTCDGVEKGSKNSLAVLDGTVFYKSAFGIVADDGGGTVEIGRALGDVQYSSAAGAILNRKYYLTLSEGLGKRQLFVYDIDKKIWCKENYSASDYKVDICYLCPGGNSLYATSNHQLLDLTGNTGTLEDKVSWKVETGNLGLEIPEQKYISRLTLRLCLEPGATLEVYVKYDSEPVWVKLGQAYGTNLRSFSLPVHPRRCDHLRLKLQGTGMCKVYSITKTLEKGSELT